MCYWKYGKEIFLYCLVCSGVWFGLGGSLGGWVCSGVIVGLIVGCFEGCFGRVRVLGVVCFGVFLLFSFDCCGDNLGEGVIGDCFIIRVWVGDSDVWMFFLVGFWEDGWC